MYTYGGDANLDGQINIDDYGQIDANARFTGIIHGWYNGDFNYDGNIDIDDYAIIDGNVGIQGPAFSTAGGATSVSGATTAVPEPTFAAGTLLVLGAASRLRRQRRQA